MAYPYKSIIAWDKTEIPEGWALCNGQTVNGIVTPDLRDRFIRGAANDTELGDTGGEDEHTHSYPSPATSADGEHDHSANPSVGNSGTSTKSPAGTNKDWAGNHDHTVGANLSDELDHTHDMNDTGAAPNIPPHIQLKFIMKVEE